jgi:hypothetical protein
MSSALSKPLFSLEFTEREPKRRSILAISLLKINYSWGLALALLMTRICVADYPHHTIAAHDLAVSAHFLDRCTYFHCYFSVP